MLKSLLPNKLKVKNTLDDIRLKSVLTTNKTIRFTEKSFFYTQSGYTQSHSEPFADIGGFIQSFPGSYESDKPNLTTGVDKLLIKYDVLTAVS